MNEYTEFKTNNSNTFHHSQHDSISSMLSIKPTSDHFKYDAINRAVCNGRRKAQEFIELIESGASQMSPKMSLSNFE